VALGPAILRMGSNLSGWSRRAHFHCSVGGLEVLPYLAQPRMAMLPKAICAAAASVANRVRCLGSPAFIGLIALTTRAPDAPSYRGFPGDRRNLNAKNYEEADGENGIHGSRGSVLRRVVTTLRKIGQRAQVRVPAQPKRQGFVIPVWEPASGVACAAGLQSAGRF